MKRFGIAACLLLVSSPLRANESIEEASIAELSAAMAANRMTSESIVRAYLQRIAEIDDSGPTLNAVLALMPDALAEARARDTERRASKLRGPLHGVPILIKDNIEAKGTVPTTAGSLALVANVTNRDAPLVARLRAGGAIILGKTNLSEWANIRSDNSSSGWSAVGGLTRNPYVLDRNACGSSSGSGAAITASLAAAAIGTETDGSITCPSGVNGLVGFKPTVGLVSRTHIVPISHSQDTAGSMARSVRDAALVLGVIAGSDPADPATVEADARKIDYAATLSADGLKGIRIGAMRDAIGSNPAIIALFDRALAVMKSAGAQIVEISDSRKGSEGMGEAEFEVLLFELKADLAAYLATTPAAVKTRTLGDVIMFNRANAATELKWFGQETFELANAKAGLDAPAYREALAKSRRLAGAEGIDRLLRDHKVDLLIGVTNGPAWTTDLVNGDHFTGPGSSARPAIAGYPHLTVPMGLVQGLPIGVSFIGGKWDDARVLSAGYAYEQASKARVKPSYRPTLTADWNDR
jgi:amidase